MEHPSKSADEAAAEAQRELLRAIARAMASFNATAEVVEMLIETHSDPASLQRAWRERRLEAVDSGMLSDPFQVEEYRKIFLEQLRGISKVIDAAAAKRAPRTGEGPK